MSYNSGAISKSFTFLKTKKKKKSKSFSFSAAVHEKVYSVSETLTQHTCGVSKSNKKLTPSLKKDT